MKHSKNLSTVHWAVLFYYTFEAETHKNVIMKKVFSLVLLALFVVAISSCREKKPTEKIEDGIEEVGDGIGDGVEDAADEVEEEVEELEN